MPDTLWEAWRDAERAQHYPNADPESGSPDEGHQYKVLVVENDSKHLADARSTSWDPLDQALEAAQALPSPAICVAVSDEATLRTMLAAETHPGAPGHVVRQLGLVVYRFGLHAALAFEQESHVGTLELRDDTGHPLVVVTRRQRSGGYLAVAVRRSRLWRMRSQPASLATRSHLMATEATPSPYEVTETPRPVGSGWPPGRRD